MAVEPLDPDDFFAERDRRARERQARRAARRGTQDGAQRLRDTTTGRWLIALVAAIAAFTLVGLVALWPGPVHHRGPSQSFGAATVGATVRRVFETPCAGTTVRCRHLVVSVDGRSTTITEGPVASEPVVSAGDGIRVARVRLRAGVTAPPGFEPYQFVDLDRHGSLLTLLLIFAALVVVLLRWRGLLALLGIGLSLAVLLTFMIPALLDGESALLVALVGSLAVMFVMLVLTNGLGAQMLAGALGIAATLTLVGVLAVIFAHAAHLDGHGTDVAATLGLTSSSLSLSGVVIAGMVVGGLGVLADTAVTQASAVMALRRADPGLDGAGLYRGAITVGRDHLSATIHTLVLAYAGAFLPVLLAMRATGLHVGDALNSQQIAEPVVAALIGCIGLVAAVPLTTGLAGLLAARIPAGALPDDHGHHH